MRSFTGKCKSCCTSGMPFPGVNMITCGPVWPCAPLHPVDPVWISRSRLLLSLSLSACPVAEPYCLARLSDFRAGLDCVLSSDVNVYVSLFFHSFEAVFTGPASSKHAQPLLSVLLFARVRTVRSRQRSAEARLSCSSMRELRTMSPLFFSRQGFS